ncbi:SUMF1/EgtB/PvdO family nonheme iron enzyme [Verrucomicrobiota bacterium]
MAEWRRPKNILVEENAVYGNSEYGVYVSAGKDIVIRTNSISGNVKYGLQLASAWNRPDIPCEYTTVENNEIHDNARNGIKLTSWNQHNWFAGNNIYSNGYGYTGSSKHYNYGFLFQDGNDNIVIDNTITNNALGGLYLWGKGDPSYNWYSTTSNAINGNIISGHSGQGIYIPVPKGYPNSGFLDCEISCNNIVSNLAYGIENADISQDIDAIHNWWGDATGPSGGAVDPETWTIADGSGDAVSAYVRFDPWLALPCEPIVLNLKKVPGKDGGRVWVDFWISRDSVTIGAFAAYLNDAEENEEIVVAGGQVKNATTDDLYCLTTDAEPEAFLLYDPEAEVRERFWVSGGRGEHPMTYVSWFGAAAFCNWLGGEDGLIAVYNPGNGWTAAAPEAGYRLPTEAEWYKAAAWDKDTKRFYTYGTAMNTISGSDANFLNSGDDYEGNSVRTSPVSFFDAVSPYGLRNASGNVWEWCHDFYEEDKSDPPVDAHAVRGGSWVNVARDVKTTSRCGNKPGQTLNSVGFRVMTMTHP